jgi:hypothetical protein
VPNTQLIINFVTFQVAWFACVLGAANAMPWLAFLFVIIIVLLQLVLNKANLKKEITLMIIISIIGGIFDQLILNHGLLAYRSHGWSNAIVPIWIIGLWITFGSTLNVSLKWLRSFPKLAILFGVIGGPLAYLGAEKLGAVKLLIMPDAMIALAIGWGILMPLLLNLSKKLDGYHYG